NHVPSPAVAPRLEPGAVEEPLKGLLGLHAAGHLGGGRLAQVVVRKKHLDSCLLAEGHQGPVRLLGRKVEVDRLRQQRRRDHATDSQQQAAEEGVDGSGGWRWSADQRKPEACSSERRLTRTAPPGPGVTRTGSACSSAAKNPLRSSRL